MTDHWLKFNKAREVTGCQCGFTATEEPGDLWGDSVVQHLLAAGADQHMRGLRFGALTVVDARCCSHDETWHMGGGACKVPTCPCTEWVAS